MLTYLSTYNVTITSLNYLFFANQSNRPSTSKGKSKAPSDTVILDENTVYLEDIDLSAVTQAQLDVGAKKLNTRPRETLNWKTPAYILGSSVSMTD